VRGALAVAGLLLVMTPIVDALASTIDDIDSSAP
jgi:hypothetical protein